MQFTEDPRKIKERTMNTYTAVTVPTQFVETTGIRFAYRRWGKRSGLPLVFNHHLTGHLDNGDPAVLDGLAKEREVIIFNNAGVASSMFAARLVAENGLTKLVRESLNAVAAAQAL